MFCLRFMHCLFDNVVGCVDVLCNSVPLLLCLYVNDVDTTKAIQWRFLINHLYLYLYLYFTVPEARAPYTPGKCQTDVSETIVQ